MDNNMNQNNNNQNIENQGMGNTTGASSQNETFSPNTARPQYSSFQQNAPQQNAQGTNGQQRYNNPYGNPYQQPQYQNFYQQPNGYAQQAPKQPKKKTQMPAFGKSLAKCSALALTFGLVGGIAFNGVNYVSNQLFGNAVQSQDVNKGNEAADNNAVANNNQPSSTGIINTTNSGYAAELTDVSGIVEEVMPSIVAITNTSTVTYQTFWGQNQSYENQSCGSGIIVRQDDKYMYIVTNNHVIDKADTLTVQFADGKTASCEVKGTDAPDDLAVVKVAIASIEKDTLGKIKVAQIGNSDEIQLGEASIAIGNALGHGQSVTTGVVSALNRTVSVADETTGATVTNSNLIQTDAAINPGNSGGALLNASGQVIGINSAKYSDTSVEGIGYAIPISYAMPIVDQLITREKVDQAQSGYLGIQGQDVSTDVSKAYGFPIGVYVYDVIKGSAAQEAGILPGDIITKLGTQQITGMSELKEQLSYYKKGETVDVTISRRGTDGFEEQTIQVTLGAQSTISQ